MFHVVLDHDCKGALVSLSGWGIANGRAGVRGLLHCLLDVFDREIRPQDRLLMRRQGLPDVDQSCVRLSRNTGLPEIGVWGTEGKAVHALVELSHRVYIDISPIEQSVGFKLFAGPADTRVPSNAGASEDPCSRALAEIIGALGACEH